MFLCFIKAKKYKPIIPIKKMSVFAFLYHCTSAVKIIKLMISIIQNKMVAFLYGCMY